MPMLVDVSESYEILKKFSDKSTIKTYKGFNEDKDLTHISYMKLMLSGQGLTIQFYRHDKKDCYLSMSKTDLLSSIGLLIEAYNQSR